MSTKPIVIIHDNTVPSQLVARMLNRHYKYATILKDTGEAYDSNAMIILVGEIEIMGDKGMQAESMLEFSGPTFPIDAWKHLNESARPQAMPPAIGFLTAYLQKGAEASIPAQRFYHGLNARIKPGEAFKEPNRIVFDRLLTAEKAILAELSSRGAGVMEYLEKKNLVDNPPTPAAKSLVPNIFQEAWDESAPAETNPLWDKKAIEAAIDSIKSDPEEEEEKESAKRPFPSTKGMKIEEKRELLAKYPEYFPEGEWEEMNTRKLNKYIGKQKEKAE